MKSIFLYLNDPIWDYSYDDYEDDDEYIGELEGFNVTTIQGSQAYEKVQAAIQ